MQVKGSILNVPADMRAALREGRHRDLVALFKQAHTAAGAAAVAAESHGTEDGGDGSSGGSILQQVNVFACSAVACDMLSTVCRSEILYCVCAL